MISSFCIPNGLLQPHYLSRPWAGGKSPEIKVAGNQILKKHDETDYVTSEDESYKDILVNLGNLKKKDVEEGGRELHEDCQGGGRLEAGDFRRRGQAAMQCAPSSA